MADIVEMLRGAAQVAYSNDIELFLKQKDCAEAADEIERLRSENAHLRGLIVCVIETMRAKRVRRGAITRAVCGERRSDLDIRE